MTSELIIQIISALGIPGVLVWYLHYTQTKTLPEKDKAHKEEVKEITDKFAATCENITDKFTNTLKDERVYRQEEITSLKAWIRSEAKCRYNSDHIQTGK